MAPVFLAPDKKGAVENRANIGFYDESGVSEKPTVRRTWALKGFTPIITVISSWKRFTVQATITCTARGRKPKLYLRSIPGSVKHDEIISYIKQLRKHIRGKLYLLWDGLPAHRAANVRTFLKTQKRWLKVYRFPAYAPELNPPEYLFSSMKAKDLPNLPAQGMAHLKSRIASASRRIGGKPKSLLSFLRASKLY